VATANEKEITVIKYILFLITLCSLASCTSTAPPPGPPAPPPMPKCEAPITTGWHKECGRVAGISGAFYAVHQTKPAEPVMTVFWWYGLLERDGIGKKQFLTQAELEALFAPYPSVRLIQISFSDQVYLFTDYPQRNAIPVEATMENWDLKILPFLQSGYTMPKPWVSMGHSMGGVNTITMCMLRPELWHRCVATSPALIDTDPWDMHVGTDNWYPARWIVQSQMGLPLERAKALWADRNPYAMLKRAKTLPPMFVSACKEMQTNLHAATQHWVRQAQAQQLPVEFLMMPDGCQHTDRPSAAVLKFVMRQ